MERVQAVRSPSTMTTMTGPLRRMMKCVLKGRKMDAIWR
jgi:hypothetical protein